MRFTLAYALALALACVSYDARAEDELIAREGQNTVRLTQRPCVPEVLKTIPEGHRGVFRLALVVYEGKSYTACWAARLDGLIHVQYDDNDTGLVPFGMFRREPGT